MPHYRRNYIEGGTFFFTVKLADPKSRLLVEHIDLLREAYASVQKRYPFETVASVACITHPTRAWLRHTPYRRFNVYRFQQAVVCMKSKTHA